MIFIIKRLLTKDQYINIESIKNNQTSLNEMYDTIIELIYIYRFNVSKVYILTLQLLLTIRYNKKEVK